MQRVDASSLNISSYMFLRWSFLEILKRKSHATWDYIHKCAHDNDLFIPGKVLLVHLTLGQILQVHMCIFQNLTVWNCKIASQNLTTCHGRNSIFQVESLRPSNSTVSTRFSHGQSGENTGLFLLWLGLCWCWHWPWATNISSMRVGIHSLSSFYIS